MAGYDILMIAVLAGTTLWGAFKGAAWQLAALASLIVSYFASYYLSDSLTGSGLFGQTAPWNRFAAMLTIYIITGIVIWMGFRFISETIEKIKLKDFDRQLGALFGLFKGMIFCVLITFFVVTLMPDKREQVINTCSGRYVAQAAPQIRLARAAGIANGARALHQTLRRKHAAVQRRRDRSDDGPALSPVSRRAQSAAVVEWDAKPSGLGELGKHGELWQSAKPERSGTFSGQRSCAGQQSAARHWVQQPRGWPAKSEQRSRGATVRFEPAVTAVLSATVAVSAIV